MTTESTTSPNVTQAVPFFGITNMEASLRFYVDGLGFAIKRHGFQRATSTIHLTEESAGVGLSLATPQSCSKSS